MDTCPECGSPLVEVLGKSFEHVCGKCDRIVTLAEVILRQECVVMGIGPLSYLNLHCGRIVDEVFEQDTDEEENPPL